MRKTKNNLTIFPPAKGLGRFKLSAAERRMGRPMRAPDDHGGEGGEGAGGEGSGGDAGAAGAEGGAGAPGGDAGADGQGQGAQAGGADDGGADGAGGGAGGDGKPGGDGSILSDAGREGDDGKSGSEGDDGKAGGEGGDGPRLTFGEGEAASEILGAPEAYELTVPPELAEQGVAFDAEAFALVEPTLRDLNLSNAAAQQVVNAYAEKIGPLLASRGASAADTVGAEMRRTWASDAEKEFSGKDGNPSLVEAKAYAKQAFIASGIKADSPFLTMLEESGLGNHPDMVRFVSWVGRNVGEAKVDAGGSGGQPLPLADRVYGKPDPA